MLAFRKRCAAAACSRNSKCLRRSVDRGRLQHPHRARAPGSQLLYLDEDVSARQFYAHPVEGLHALVDVSTLEVLEVHDHFEASGDYIPVPRTPLNYDAELLHKFRKPSSRLDVVQPDGAGFVVQGNQVVWENWDFRVGFNGREGLVLYTIGYTQDGKRRPIVYRASIAEMVVPYGTPERSHYRKNVFDSGELGFGRMANSLTLGCDCLGVIHYFDAVVADLFGNPRTIERCICLHEEDAGMSWKHFDLRTDRTEVRRARKPGDLVHFDHRQLRICVVLVSAPGWAH
jgi:primary-amine oxidase